jgi:hypothetical protein
VNLLDTTFLLGGYGQSIVDWALGDDRSFNGDVYSLLLPGDNVTKGILTLKAAPTAPDAFAIIQKIITQTPNNPAGQIQQSIQGGGFTLLTFNVFSADYEGIVASGSVYGIDCRVITSMGHTYTVATGMVDFVQNVTQTNIAGTPGPPPQGPPLNGQPRFRGWIPTNPMIIPNLSGYFTKGDYYRNSNPQPGEPSGWVCMIGGQLPGGALFFTDGIVGDSPGL